MIGVLPLNMHSLKHQVSKRNSKSHRKTEWKFVENVLGDVERSLFELKPLVDVAVNITNPGIPFETKQNRKQFKVEIFCNADGQQMETDLDLNEGTDLLSMCSCRPS